jgi:hypothetical protein
MSSKCDDEEQHTRPLSRMAFLPPPCWARDTDSVDAIAQSCAI